jgi:hypothetical protein
MVRTLGGIGAVGSAKARFFHPSKNIREQWPNRHETLRVAGVLIVGKGLHRVRKKEQMCYECRIPEIDDNTIFHIVCANFKVVTGAATPFEDELTLTPVLRVPTESAEERARVAALRLDEGDITPNVRGAFVAEDIAELRREGIEVDDDNEPAPENAQPTPAAPATLFSVGEWVTPTICPRKADPNCSNRGGDGTIMHG